MVGYRLVAGAGPLYHHMGRDYLRMKPKEKEGEPKDGEGQTHRSLLELWDQAMSEAPVTGMTCHLNELTLVMILSPETKES